jgi:hypothetical protein
MEIGKTESPLALARQMREQTIKHGIEHAQRLMKVRMDKLDHVMVAVKKGGGLAIINAEHPEHGLIYRFGAVSSSHIAFISMVETQRWNQRAPDQEVERLQLGVALGNECANIWLILKTIEDQIERLELEGNP